MLTTDGVVEGTDPIHTVLSQMQLGERRTFLTAVIESTLDGIEQDVLYHRYVDGLPRKRVAELLELRDDDVRAILARTKRHLTKAIQTGLEALGHSMWSGNP
jgi:DNA-directed RNA polymerase specialized sigma subunit